jgi:hypothetical protein
MMEDVLLANRSSKFDTFSGKLKLLELNGGNLRSGDTIWSASESNRERFTGPLVMNTRQDRSAN